MRFGSKLGPVVVVFLLAALVGAIFGHGSGPYKDTPDKTPPPARFSDAHDGPLVPPSEPQARLAARGFLAAFMRYEVGALSPAARRSLLHTATPALASSLLRQPARAVHSATPARDARLADLSLADASARVVQYFVTVARGGGVENFSLIVTHTAGGWRVSQVTP